MAPKPKPPTDSPKPKLPTDSVSDVDTPDFIKALDDRFARMETKMDTRAAKSEKKIEAQAKKTQEVVKDLVKKFDEKQSAHKKRLEQLELMAARTQKRYEEQLLINDNLKARVEDLEKSRSTNPQGDMNLTAMISTIQEKQAEMMNDITSLTHNVNKIDQDSRRWSI